MSLIQMSFFSQTLNRIADVNIILPLPRHVQASFEDVPVLYLLHGMGDDYTAWLRKTNIERYALEAGLAVIMPDGGLSCYENMAHGECFRDYMRCELPSVMRSCFPISTKREKTFIAGCSMGGHGALKTALAQPEIYSAVGCFSASLLEYRPDVQSNRLMLERVYGDALSEADARNIAAAKHVAAGDMPLRVWHSCGDDDMLLECAGSTRDFFEKLQGNAIDYHFELLRGRHDWRQWDAAVERFIGFLHLPETDRQLM